jgi:hypothetical protein
VAQGVGPEFKPQYWKKKSEGPCSFCSLSERIVPWHLPTTGDCLQSLAFLHCGKPQSLPLCGDTAIFPVSMSTHFLFL